MSISNHKKVSEFKTTYLEAMGKDNELRLMYGGKEMKDAKTLAFYGVADEMVIIAMYRN